MPEMPEVEVMVDRLQKYVGYSIVTADGRGGKRYLPENEKVFVSGQKIRGVFRRGKFIIFMLDRGAILAHNAMSGYWDTIDERWTFDYVEGKRESKDTDIRCCFLLCKEGVQLAGNGVNLLFHDARKFGSLRYLEPDELAKKLSTLGPEASNSLHEYESKRMEYGSFILLCNSYKKSIKELLMDQTKITGVGNIYASEALTMALVDPRRRACDLSAVECQLVIEAVRTVMAEALYRGLDYSGLKIYRKKECGYCKAPVLTAKIAGRSSYWCSACQH